MTATQEVHKLVQNLGSQKRELGSRLSRLVTPYATRTYPRLMPHTLMLMKYHWVKQQ